MECDTRSHNFIGQFKQGEQIIPNPDVSNNCQGFDTNECTDKSTPSHYTVCTDVIPADPNAKTTSVCYEESECDIWPVFSSLFQTNADLFPQSIQDRVVNRNFLWKNFFVGNQMNFLSEFPILNCKKTDRNSSKKIFNRA